MDYNKRSFYKTLVLLFVVAFFCGALLKRVAGQNMRIGFEDPETVVQIGTLYDIDKAEQRVLDEMLEQQNQSVVEE